MAKMLKLILKNFINKPATRLYPTTSRPPFERTRGRIYFNEKTCIYCSICARKCPADAIKVTRGTSTWELDAFRCIVCGECVAACPKKSITMNNEIRHSSPNKKYVIIQNDEAAATQQPK